MINLGLNFTMEPGYSQALPHRTDVREALAEFARSVGRRFVTSGLRRSSHASSEAMDKRTLAAIADYARFIAAHPTMPQSHRDRFLKAIVRCCDELSENPLVLAD